MQQMKCEKDKADVDKQERDEKRDRTGVEKQKAGGEWNRARVKLRQYPARTGKQWRVHVLEGKEHEMLQQDPSQEMNETCLDKQ